MSMALKSYKIHKEAISLFRVLLTMTFCLTLDTAMNSTTHLLP